MFLTLLTLFSAQAANSPGTTDGSDDALNLNITLGANTPINCTVTGTGETPAAYNGPAIFNAGATGPVTFGDTGTLPGQELRGFFQAGTWQVVTELNVQCFTPGGTWDMAVDGTDVAGTATLVGFSPGLPPPLPATVPIALTPVPSASAVFAGENDGNTRQLTLGVDTTASSLNASFTLTFTPN